MRRPRRLIPLVGLLIGLALFNLLGVVSGLQQWALLNRLALSVSPVYLVVSRGVWAVVFVVVSVGVWRLTAWGRWGILLALGVYFVQGWVERLWFERSGIGLLNVGFLLSVQVIILALVTLSVWRPPIYLTKSVDA